MRRRHPIYPVAHIADYIQSVHDQKNNMIDFPRKIWRMRRGMTLIEVMLYSALLSILLCGFIDTAYSIYIRDVNIMQQIQYAQNS